MEKKKALPTARQIIAFEYDGFVWVEEEQCFYDAYAELEHGESSGPMTLEEVLQKRAEFLPEEEEDGLR